VNICEIEKWFAVICAVLTPLSIIAAMFYKRKERGDDMARYQEKRMREINAQRIEEIRKPRGIR
jgi:hypothetical protein